MKENQERLHTLESQVQYKGEIVMNQPNLGVSTDTLSKAVRWQQLAVTAFHVLPSKMPVPSSRLKLPWLDAVDVEQCNDGFHPSG